MGHQTPTGYSADVRIWLRHQGRMIPLSHSAATFVIPCEPLDLPPGEADIIFTVDGTRYERAVTLPGGMSSHSREVMVTARDGNAPF